MDYQFLLVIAIILLSTKVFGLLSEKVHMPQVVGALLAGVILGPSVLGMISETDFLLQTSEIGVIILMFTAGLDTELEELKKTGLASAVIAIFGVLVPLAGGWFVYTMFYNDVSDPNTVLKAIFIGVVLTATSVSITVETLREMGHLKGKIGTAILGAAIIDDILGLIVLTVVSAFTTPDVHIGMVFAKILMFFVFIAVVGLIAHKIFEKVDPSWGEKRRIAIVGLAFCLIMAYISEEFFGIADITGAYFAGLILCNIMRTKNYIAKKMTVVSYIFFSPLFFASIGIKTEVAGLTPKLIAFSAVLLIFAILTKIIGCGIGAKLCKFSTHEAVCVGVGMVSRGEVALIVAQKGAQFGLVDDSMFPAVVIVVVITTLITPILLKLVMKDDKPETQAVELTT